MNLIKLLDNNDVVSIEITITGPVAWRYDYVAYDYTYSKDSKDSPPFIHALGFNRDIDGERHFWDIYIDNIGTAPANFTAAIVWRQGRRVLDRWNQSGSLEPNGFQALNDNARLRQG